MIKTLIVDDEPNIREGLKLIIDWEKLGFEIIGEAANGREALLRIEKYRPELIITDIKMPEVSGLELISECNKLGFNSNFIILSGHNEFEMARKAIHLGASSYLLKPVDEVELEKVLIKLKNEKLSNKSRELSNKYYLKAQLKQVISSKTIADIIEVKKSFNLTNEISYYYGIIDFHNSGVKEESIEDIITEILPDGVLTTTLHEKNECYGFLIHSGMLREFKNSINRFSMFLISNISIKYDYEVSIYLGTKKHSLTELNISRDEALSTMEHKYYREYGNVIEYSAIQGLDFDYEYNELPEVDQMYTFFIDGNNNGINGAIDDLIKIFIDKYLSAQIIFLHLNKLLHQILNTITELNGDTEDIVSASEFITKRSGHIYLYSLKPKLQHLMAVSMSTLKKLKNRGNTASEFKDFIDSHYKENLSLKYVADIMNVNSAYLGQIFKKQIGVSFNKYLHDLRLSEAKSLLKNSNLKIYEVAEQVGYQDVNYFMKKFESSVKTTPKNYRKQFN